MDIDQLKHLVELKYTNIINNMTKTKRKWIALVLSAMCITSYGQDVALKTNALYDATGTINLGTEIGLSPKWTLDIPINYNPWEPKNGRLLKHFLIQPEARYWFCERFNRHFIGAHLHYGLYNAGNFDMPFNIDNGYLENNIYKGWLVGAGVSYGYHYIINRRWSLEGTIGVGYAYLGYDKYKVCDTCKEKTGNENKHYLGPTKAALSLIYIIK